MQTDKLSDKETTRYSRHILLQEIGEAGQLKLKAATVVIIGVGGLGCPAALYLAGAGVGKLILVDGDSVDTSNLQRQIMYKANHVGAGKAASAQKSLYGLNALVDVETVNQMVNDKNIDGLVQKADVVLDCTDNFASRHLINQTCFKHATTLISGAAIRGEGQFMVFDFANDKSAPCYNCLFPKSSDEPTLNCANSGVFGPVLGIVGSMQALEAMKFIIGHPLKTAGKLQMFDGMSLQWMSFNMTKVDGCEVCG